MILTHHHVAPLEAVPREWDPIEGWENTLTPASFERQLGALQRRGYRFIQLADLVDDIRKRGAEEPKTAVVTFDDGWTDNYLFALPILKRLGVPAMFFVTTGHINQGVTSSKQMNVPELKDLLRAGMTIGGHGRSHLDLTKLPPDQARLEMVGCKEDLEAALGVDIRFFAYPGGAFNRGIARLAREAGYAAACSVLGPARNETSSLFWLYRDTLSETMDSWRDRYRLSPTPRRLFSFRVHRKLQRRLEDKPQTRSANES